MRIKAIISINAINLKQYTEFNHQTKPAATSTSVPNHQNTTEIYSMIAVFSLSAFRCLSVDFWYYYFIFFSTVALNMLFNMQFTRHNHVHTLTKWVCNSKNNIDSNEFYNRPWAQHNSRIHHSLSRGCTQTHVVCMYQIGWVFSLLYVNNSCFFTFSTIFVKIERKARAMSVSNLVLKEWDSN